MCVQLGLSLAVKAAFTTRLKFCVVLVYVPVRTYHSVRKCKEPFIFIFPYVSGQFGTVEYFDSTVSSRETAVMILHLNARGDSLPAASRPYHRWFSLRYGTACEGNRSACGGVHVWHRLPDVMKTGRACFPLFHLGIFLLESTYHA